MTLEQARAGGGGKERGQGNACPDRVFDPWEAWEFCWQEKPAVLNLEQFLNCSRAITAVRNE